MSARHKVEMNRSVLLLSRKLTDVIQNGEVRQVEKLLKQGANPNLLQPEGITPFHYAVGQQDARNLELTRVMLEYGADPNIRSTERMTPLHVAATWGHIECLRLLLLNGGDPEIRDQEGLDCLDLASQYDNPDCTELLVDFMRETEEDGCRYTIVPYDDKETLSFLLNERKAVKEKVIRPAHRNTALYTEDINNILSSYLMDGHKDGNLIFDVTSPSHPFLEPRQSQRTSSLENHRRSSENKSDLTGSSDESYVTCASEDPANISQNNYPAPDIDVHKLYLSKKFQPIATSSPPASVVHDEGNRKVISRRWGGLDGCNDSGFEASHSCVSPRGFTCQPCQNLNQNNRLTTQPCNHAQNQCCNNSQNLYSLHNSAQSCPNFQRPLIPLSQNQYHGCADCETKFQHNGKHFRQSKSAKSLVDKFTGISLDDEKKSDSDSSSLFSHISCATSIDSVTKLSNPTLSNLCRIGGNKPPVAKSYDKGNNCAVISDTDSLADFIPKDFNMSDLTINSYNPNKRVENGLQMGRVPIRRDRTSLESAVSSASTVDYLYFDPDEGVALIERHCPSICSTGSVRTSLDSVASTQVLEDSDNDTVLYDWEDYVPKTPVVKDSQRSGSTNSCASQDSEKTLVNTPRSQTCGSVSSVDKKPASPVTPDIPPLLRRLSNKQLKDRLVSLGDDPGPITKSTRQTYLVRLVDLENNPNLSRIVLTNDKPGYCPELRKALVDKFSFVGLEESEALMVDAFQKPNPDRKWREGVLKSSFNYLLLDPRVAQNLPLRSQALGDLEIFNIFINAIFYIGKGKRSRPYCHLYEAIKHMNFPQSKKPSEKVEKILDIWRDGSGVISLHIFQNVIPVEAYTREACMVDALGLGMLTNKKRGDYYGVSSTWAASQRRQIGVHLLRKALRIYLAEGERQISPPDIGIGQ